MKRYNAKTLHSVTRPGMVRVDPTLYLAVSDGARGLRRSWIQRIVVRGRRIDRGLGPYHYGAGQKESGALTLEEARDKAHDNRRAVRRGENPFAVRRTVEKPPAPTFKEVVDIIIDRNASTWAKRTRGDRIAALNRYAMPKLGTLSVDAIRTSHLEAVLKRMWDKKPTAARRVRGLIHEVLEWAVAHEHRVDNPAGTALDAVLPKAKGTTVKSMASVPHAEVGDAIRTLRGTGADDVTKLAFEFLIHTATRSKEVREARWSEIDLDSCTWTIAASRLKMRRDQRGDHRVPLSVQAMRIIRTARANRRRGRDTLVFDTGRGKPISPATFPALAQSAELKGTAHGFRASFATWCADNAIPEDLREAALAHFNRDRVAAVYQRSDMVERRREVMQRWSDYIAPIERKRPRTD